MDNCIFCRIAQKKEESFIVHESTHILAFLDTYPASNGHILVIPKKHFNTFDEIADENVLEELIYSIQYLCKTLVEKGLCRDYTIIQNNGENAEQDIKHVHFHIIPRYQDDLINIDLNNNAKKASFNELLNILDAFK
ncbi:HIT domain-containing protein [Bacillus infantis]|uniref:HIT family protein n=1 Tax=Bacillus infantis TaxID=324767 RepID=UPI001CD739CE|nr:HIT domain-containing protein [Bacillus infantis]MCA1037491.1 HIT domain-containing protein [Bacillus infantis]HER2025499.1 HIT domain-containing protein [Streptococcus pyogenes]